MIQDRHNALRSSKIKKVNTYGEFRDEIMRLKWEGHELLLKDRDLYVDGKLSVMWPKGYNKCGKKVPLSVRFSESSLEYLTEKMKMIGCSMAEIIDILIDEVEKKGGIKSIADACMIRSFDSSQKRVEKKLEEIELIKGGIR